MQPTSEIRVRKDEEGRISESKTSLAQGLARCKENVRLRLGEASSDLAVQASDRIPAQTISS